MCVLVAFFFFFFFFKIVFVFSLAGDSGRLAGKAQQPQEQRYPFLSVCAAFLCLKYASVGYF